MNFFICFMLMTNEINSMDRGNCYRIKDKLCTISVIRVYILLKKDRIFYEKTTE